jgi:hypothetical protein
MYSAPGTELGFATEVLANETTQLGSVGLEVISSD